jgi:hypothetical protein
MSCKSTCKEGATIRCKNYTPWVSISTMQSWCASANRRFSPIEHFDHPTIKAYGKEQGE